MFGPLSYISWGTKEAMSYINTLWQPTSKSMPEMLCGVSSQFLWIRAEETDEPIIPTTTLIIREKRCPGLRLLLWWNTRPKPTWERDAYLVHRFRSIIRVNQSRNLEAGSSMSCSVWFILHHRTISPRVAMTKSKSGGGREEGRWP